MDNKIVFRYHRAPDPHDCGRVMIFDSDPKASWLDDYMGPEHFMNLKLKSLALTVAG
jgi:hypothetical protein